MLQPKPWRRSMVVRDHSEGHRQASWLELLFDLSFVVAVAQAAIQLEHFFAEGHVVQGLVAYSMAFAAVWWAWMAFTWFANVFDTDDLSYRLLMMVLIAGSLGLAAGVPRMAQLDLRIAVISYVVMRLAYVAQMVRVWRTQGPIWRPIAFKVIVLTILLQIGWIAMLWVPENLILIAFVIWFAADLSAPIIAGWDSRKGGHHGHLVERYGLFTIIVLGESIAAATVAVGRAVETDLAVLPLLILATGGLAIVFSIWWIYFDFLSTCAPAAGRVAQVIWGYGHYFLFSAVAAIGAGLSLAALWLSEPDHVALSERGVALAVGGAVAAVLVAIVIIESAPGNLAPQGGTRLKIVAAVLVIGAALAAPWVTVPGSVLLVGLVLATLVGHGVIAQHRLHLAA